MTPAASWSLLGVLLALCVVGVLGPVLPDRWRGRVLAFAATGTVLLLVQLATGTAWA